MKKGIYYSMDALMASAILIGAILLLTSSSLVDKNLEQRTFVSQDILSTLTELKMYELNNSFVEQEILEGNITDLNKSVLDQIGEYWARNYSDKAKTLLTIVVNDSLPADLGFSMSFTNDTFVLNNQSTLTDLVSSQRMISGIEENKPLVGSSASAYLKKISGKKTSSYLYFGGFVGQGNISANIVLPADYNSSRMVFSELRLESPGQFELFINENKCGGTYNGITGEVTLWNITGCADDFEPLSNNITIKFLSSLNESFISGGYLKATYTTDTLNENISKTFERYEFPVVEGFINLYDSFAVQGIVTNWTLNISFFNEYDTFLTIGNETIFLAPGDNETQNILISDLTPNLNPAEIPLRLGVTNLSNITIIDEGLPADSFLVTDVSGSMDDCGSYYEEEYCRYDYRRWCWWTWGDWTEECSYSTTCVDNECGVPNYCASYGFVNHEIYNKSICDNSRIEVAKAADKLFVETILNESTLHQIGLVDFSTDAHTPTDLTNIEAVLDAEIDSYNADGGTCTCCGINRARTLLNESPNHKFMIVLSDGEPTHYCTSFNDFTGSSGSSSAETWAIDAGQRACSENITVYTIGFGDGMSADGHEVMKQIACNDSLYFNATDTEDLAQIYENISNQVLVAANFTSQTINILGDYSPSRIFPDSYIDLYYEPFVPVDTQSKLSVTLESEQFETCDTSIYIPDNVQIEDAFITSFSGNHWTRLLTANNNVVFNLSEYGDQFKLLGDPFTIQIPSGLFNVGDWNDISLVVGDSPDNTTGCSANNTLIYKALINSSTPRTSPAEFAEGCLWTIETESGKLIDVPVPSDYTSYNECNYTNSSIIYNPSDAYDSAVYGLLYQLDYNSDGKILVDIDDLDLEIFIITTGKIPYMWGPTLVRSEVWR